MVVLSYRELSKKLKIPLNTIYQHLGRAEFDKYITTVNIPSKKLNKDKSRRFYKCLGVNYSPHFKEFFLNFLQQRKEK